MSTRPRRIQAQADRRQRRRLPAGNAALVSPSSNLGSASVLPAHVQVPRNISAITARLEPKKKNIRARNSNPVRFCRNDQSLIPKRPMLARDVAAWQEVWTTRAFRRWPEAGHCRPLWQGRNHPRACRGIRRWRRHDLEGASTRNPGGGVRASELVGWFDWFGLANSGVVSHGFGAI